MGNRRCGNPADFPAKKKRPFSPLAAHRCVIFFCIVCFLPLGGNTFAAGDLTARKRVLSEKLDSIDLEKQLRKRRGESLEDLEKAAESLKDSIASLKRQMPSSGQGAQEADDTSGKAAVAGPQAPGWLQPFQKFLPKTFFDWMVDIVGFIAIISGIVLVIGIFGLLSKGLRKRKKAAPLHKPLHEIFPRSYAADAYDRIPKVPGGQTEENNEDIASLRKRIGDADATPPVKGPDDEGVLATVDDSGVGSDDLTGRPAGSPEVKKQVLAAARQGLDVSEISRRFHISSDEVSLILRMARRDDVTE